MANSTRGVTPNRVLVMSTFAFTVCFAVWLFYGALIKYLTKAGLYQFTPSEVGMLIAAPILTGSVLRLPAGVLTDRYGGRPVFVGTLLLSALGVASVALASGFWGFLFAGLCFGISGASFAVQGISLQNATTGCSTGSGAVEVTDTVVIDFS